MPVGTLIDDSFPSSVELFGHTAIISEYGYDIHCGFGTGEYNIKIVGMTEDQFTDLCKTLRSWDNMRAACQSVCRVEN